MRTFTRPNRLTPGMLLWVESEEFRCKLACRLIRMYRNQRAEVQIIGSLAEGGNPTVDVFNLYEECFE